MAGGRGAAREACRAAGAHAQHWRCEVVNFWGKLQRLHGGESGKLMGRCTQGREGGGCHWVVAVWRSGLGQGLCDRS